MARQTQLAAWIESIIGEDKPFDSNVELAETCDITEGTIRRIRHGHTTRIDTLKKLAKGTGRPLEDLQAMHVDQYVEDPEQDAISQTLNLIEDLLRRLPRDRQMFYLNMAKAMAQELEQNSPEAEEDDIDDQEQQRKTA